MPAQQPPMPYPYPQPVPVPPKKKRRFNCLLLILSVFLIPLFLCGVTLVIYVLIPPAPLTISILGVDARPNEGYVTRTDSIVLMNLRPSSLQVSLLSIPRDLFVNVPNYGLQRVNTVNALGEQEQSGYGPVLFMESIESNFNMDVNHYIRVNFDAFVQLVDGVGGITVDVPRTIVDGYYPTVDGGTMTVTFEQGVQHLNGEQALQYARTRYTDDDYARAHRQQQVISALSVKLINPLNWFTAVSVLTRNVDSNLNILELGLYAPTFLLNAGRFEQLVIDREYITSSDGVAVPNYALLDEWLNAHFR